MDNIKIKNPLNNDLYHFAWQKYIFYYKKYIQSPKNYPNFAQSWLQLIDLVANNDPVISYDI